MNCFEFTIRQVGAHGFSVTNIAGDLSEFGAPILNENGMLVGMCNSFEYHLSARSILAIADTLEGSQNRPFMVIILNLNNYLNKCLFVSNFYVLFLVVQNVQAALDHLYDII